MLARLTPWFALVLVAALVMAPSATAQDFPDPAFMQIAPAKLPGQVDRLGVQLIDNGLPNYMITGYWPPTNEMLRKWSTDPNQRPVGQPWVGENWEGRGFNIYAFFPEFPGGTASNPKGNGDFEVDYQDTSPQWWDYTSQIKPLLITTFSRGGVARAWEFEGGNRFYVNNLWTNDYLAPTKPTVNEIADDPNRERWSTLPMQTIVSKVSAAGLNLTPSISVIDDGRFLSNYIGYHGNWYRDLNVDNPNVPGRCLIAGHIHVGSSAAVADCVVAVEITLREVIRKGNGLMGVAGDLDCDGALTFSDIDPFVTALGGAVAYYEANPDCFFGLADMDGDGLVTFSDIDPFIDALSSAE